MVDSGDIRVRTIDRGCLRPWSRHGLVEASRPIPCGSSGMRSGSAIEACAVPAAVKATVARVSVVSEGHYLVAHAGRLVARIACGVTAKVAMDGYERALELAPGEESPRRLRPGPVALATQPMLAEAA